MIEFLTLFLGLVVGPQMVEMAVDPSIAEVDLHLDGDIAARLEEPPWQALVDFGPDLRPHEIEALAIGTDGEIADRVSQAVNRPRPEAEAVVFLERDASGRPVAARVSWETTTVMRPIESTVTLDGEVLEVSGVERFALPASTGDEFHFLQVDLQFAGGISAHTQVVYGGTYLDEAERELTAVPVVFTKGKSRKPSELAGWFTRDGQPQRVVAVEKGPAEIIVVRADAVRTAAAGLEGLGFGIGSGVVGASGGTSPGVEGSMPSGPGAMASSGERNRRALSFEGEANLRLLLPKSTAVERERVTHRAFVISPRLTSRQGGLLWALTQEFYAPGMSESERVADAVAVAAMRAAWGSRRRAVVLALSGDEPDLSVLSTPSVRRYLQTLDVPLFVWSFEEEDSATRSSLLREWPEAQRIATFRDLTRAVRDLKKSLEEQRVVWLEGAHAPESIRIATGAQAQRLGEVF